MVSWWAVYGCAYGNVREGVEFREERVSWHVCLVMAAGGGDEMGSD